VHPHHALVTVQSPADFAKALKTFERKVRAEGVLTEAKRRAYFEPKHEVTRRKRAAAHRRRLRRHRPRPQGRPAPES